MTSARTLAAILGLGACGSTVPGTPDARGDDARAADGPLRDAPRPADARSGADAAGATDAAIGACGGAKPGPTNTGVPPGTTLTASGSFKVTQDGAEIHDLDIAGTITVLANDVTIRRVRITTDDYYPIRYFDAGNTGLIVEDSEIIGQSGKVTSAIAFTDYTARRLNIHGSADGLKADSNVTIEGCWIHDLSNGDGEHNDGVQSTGGKGVTIRGTAISGASNAAVQAGDENAATEDLTIECSWLSGGGYTLNIRGKGATVPKNTVIRDNRFGRDSAYGAWTFDDPRPTVTGNVWDNDGSPIPYP